MHSQHSLSLPFFCDGTRTIGGNKIACRIGSYVENNIELTSRAIDIDRCAHHRVCRLIFLSLNSILANGVQIWR